MQTQQHWHTLTEDAGACLVNSMHGDAAVTDTFASSMGGADSKTPLDGVLRILCRAEQPMAQGGRRTKRTVREVAATLRGRDVVA